MADLEVEYGFFRRHREQFAIDHNRKFVLIKNTGVHGFYDTAEAAYITGLDRFGNSPFLVKQVIRDYDEAIQVPALTAGLLRAYP